MPAPTLTGSSSEYLVAPTYCFTDDGVTQASVGQQVKRWYNILLAGFMEQVTLGSRPTLRQDASSNYYLEFDGTDDYLDSATGLFNGAVISYSIACVIRGLPTSTQVICRASHSASASAHGIFLEASHLSQHGRNSGTSFVGYRYRDLHPNASIVAQNVWDTTNDILYHRCYGSATGSGSLSSVSMTPGSLNHFRIGANSGTAGVYGKINVYALVQGNGLWSSTEREDLESYHAALLPANPIAPALENLSSATSLWTSGSGYNTFRIPVVCWYDDGTSNGILFAAAEGRSSTADDGNVDIVLRSSTDLGATWAASATIQDNGTNVAGNPVLVPDPANGKLHLLFVRQTAGDGAGHGATTRRPWYTYSTDDGATWATAVELTTVRESGWSWYAFGPARGVVLPNGRIVVPANHSDAIYGSPYYKAHLVYSDDGGATWAKSSAIGPLGANEMSLDVSGSGVLCTIRNTAGSRLFMLSADGSTVADATAESDLAGNACQAGMVIMGGRMLLSHVASATRTDCLVLSATDYDADPTFDRGTEISYAESGSALGAAYSQMCEIPGNKAAILWEYGSSVGAYTDVRFQTFDPLDLDLATFNPAWARNSNVLIGM
jgi:sialidase-1